MIYLMDFSLNQKNQIIKLKERTKEYKNINEFLISNSEFLKSNDITKIFKEIKNNKVVLNEFQNFCYFFLKEYANLTIIKDEKSKTGKLLTNDIALEELKKETNKNIENDLYKNDELYLKEINYKDTINENFKINEIEKRNIEDMIKEIYIDNEIDINELKKEFEEKEYNIKYKNIYNLILNILDQE